MLDSLRTDIYTPSGIAGQVRGHIAACITEQVGGHIPPTNILMKTTVGGNVFGR